MVQAKDQNDKAGFDDLFREYFKPLCAYCQYRFGLSLDESKDAVHSGFIKLLESGGNFTSKVSGRAYLYKVITNLCLDLIRHDSVKKKHELSVQNEKGAEWWNEDKLAEFKELQSNINKAIAELPDQMRRVFELSRFEGLKYAEIATQLNISVKTVETQMSRALAKLRINLSSYLTLFWFLLLIEYGVKIYFF